VTDCSILMILLIVVICVHSILTGFTTMEKLDGGLAMFALLIAALIPIALANPEGNVRQFYSVNLAWPSSFSMKHLGFYLN
jgi:hypothetical protein